MSHDGIPRLHVKQSKAFCLQIFALNQPRGFSMPAATYKKLTRNSWRCQLKHQHDNMNFITHIMHDSG
jgi:hypothetical protein